ncbi:MAG TPA: class I SAM-dependent methyltransferase [Vicinamibacterales bacterium]|nr:class I SAM-dependent methyltransferase [Vicinamibacterales bacterium]HJO39554.1 class I SAM-dependent methyltransferase [Vicinamibacterales bacterium]
MNDELAGCRACGSSADAEHLYRKNGYAILRCRACGLVFASPHPSRAELGRIYSESFFQVGEKFAGQSRSPGTLNAERRARWLREQRGVTAGRWLDIGCATGDFMMAARPYVMQVSGIEMSSYAADQARARGPLDVTTGDVLDVSLGAEPFDVVTMWDVVEHVTDPLATLRRASDALRDGGVLALSTGDIESVAARVMGRFWHLMIPPRHLYFFSPSTIASLLDRAGFDAVSVSKPGKRVPLDFAVWKAATLITPKAGPVALRLSAAAHLGRLAPFVNLGDIMTVLARKRSSAATSPRGEGVAQPPAPASRS